MCVSVDRRVNVCVRYLMTGAVPQAHGLEFRLTEQPMNCSCSRLVSIGLAIGSQGYSLSKYTVFAWYACVCVFCQCVFLRSEYVKMEHI